MLNKLNIEMHSCTGDTSNTSKLWTKILFFQNNAVPREFL